MDYQKTSVYPVLPHSDSAAYLALATDIQSGDGPWTHKAFDTWPLYAYLLAFLLKVTGQNIAAVYSLQFLIGLAHVFVLFLIGKKLFGNQAAFWAAGLSAGYGLFLVYEGLLVYTSLSLLFNSLFFYWMIRESKRENAGYFFLTGLFLGVCALTQPNFILFGFFAAAWKAWRHPESLFKKSVFVLLFSAGFGCLIGATMLRNYFAEKDWVPVSGNLGMNLYIGNGPDANGLFACPENFMANKEAMARDAAVEARQVEGRMLKTSEISAYWIKKTALYILQNPKRVAELLVIKFTGLWAPREFDPETELVQIRDRIRIFRLLPMDMTFWMPLVLFGMAASIAGKRPPVLLFAAVFLTAANLSVFFLMSKLRLALIPFLLLFAAFALDRLYRTVFERKYSKLMLSALGLFLCLVASQAVQAFAESRTALSKTQLAYERHLAAGQIFEERGQDDEAVREYAAASEAAPQYFFPHLAIGSVRLAQGRLDEAHASFQKALMIQPLNIESAQSLAAVYGLRGNYTEALRILNDALALDSQNASLLFDRGKIHKMLGRAAEARADFETAMNLTRSLFQKDIQTIQQEISSLPAN